jgi:hypothetical protein
VRRKAEKKNGRLGSKRTGILASLLFAFLLFVVQILQVSGSHFVGVGRSEKPKPIWVQFDERKRSRREHKLRGRDEREHHHHESDHALEKVVRDPSLFKKSFNGAILCSFLWRGLNETKKGTF